MQCDVVAMPRNISACVLCLVQCKHQLAAHLADALHRCAVHVVPDTLLTQMLLSE